MGLSLSNERRVTDKHKSDARRLRASMTEAEDCLWQALRGKKLNGLKFRRQQPVIGFVVDFYCEALDLAIELDGGIHDDPAVANRDKHREDALKAEGLRIVRFKNHEVLEDLPRVLQQILTPHAPPPPHRGGEGAGVPN